MCGIAGYYGFDSNQSLLQIMNKCIAHRGPDGEGYYTDGLVGLTHRRLAIIDREGGAQPMYTSDKSLAIVFNGEIYNYKALRTELQATGRTFVTESDTEVVLQAYQEWGDDCFDKFNGMFAIAIHDKPNDRFVLARDHFGIKPLYYANIGDVQKPKLLFASEITPLLKTGIVNKKPNDRVIYRYLKFRIHEEAAETFFDGVYRLGAGELAVIDAGGLAIRPFTNLRSELGELAKKNIPFDETQVAAYREKLTEAVRLRLQSEVPVGTSLSGGLDSSAVVAIINQLMQEKASDHTVDSVGAQQNTFSAVFPNSVNDEEKYVDAVLEKCQAVVSHKIKPTADEFAKDIEDFIRTQEEPLISTGPYAQYKVMQEATNHVTVLLDGQGADEMMAGYIPYYFVYLRQLKARGQWVKLLGETITSFDVLVKLARFKLQAKVLRRKNVPMAQLLHSDFKKLHSHETFTVTPNHLKHRLIEDLFSNSLPSLLRYEDRNTMHFGLEGRVPFLDKEVVKYLFSLSDEAIIHHGWNKRILRDAVSGLLPEMITRRRNKIGFTTPEVEWFMRLKNRFYGIFLSEEFANRPYFNQNEVLVAFEGFIQGKNDTDSMLFWRLLNVELWLREFFDEKKPQQPTREKTDYEPNSNKQLDITNSEGTFRRFPLKTDLFAANTNLPSAVKQYVTRFFEGLPPDTAKNLDGAWHLFISEKVVAITQGRSYFIWDIKVSRWARVLSRFVTKTPYGIGLGSPWTMQLAIQEVGLARVLYASVGGFIGKLFGKRGVFYNLVGDNIRAIDGPTEYSVYPANVSAKLAPKDPDTVASQLSEIIKATVPEHYAKTFAGTVVMDANDIGRNALGKDATGTNEYYEAIFADNPLGQSSEQTPIAIVFKQK